jgi:hypothetical protein
LNKVFKKMISNIFSFLHIKSINGEEKKAFEFFVLNFFDVLNLFHGFVSFIINFITTISQVKLWKLLLFSSIDESS